jgi:hypothetical protein
VREESFDICGMFRTHTHRDVAKVKTVGPNLSLFIAE